GSAETAAVAAAACRKLRRANRLMVPFAAFDRHLPSRDAEVYAATARLVSAVLVRRTAAVRHDQFLPVSPRHSGGTCWHTYPVWQKILLFAALNRTLYRRSFHGAGFSLAILPIPPLQVRFR